MRKVTVIDETGNRQVAYLTDYEGELKKQLETEKRTNVREHLYMTYLIIGTIALSFSIFISLRTLNGKKGATQQ